MMKYVLYFLNIRLEHDHNAVNSKTASVCYSSAYELSLSIVPDMSFKLPAGTLYEILTHVLKFTRAT